MEILSQSTGFVNEIGKNGTLASVSFAVSLDEKVRYEGPVPRKALPTSPHNPRSR
jgi:hypothetical protein